MAQTSWPFENIDTTETQFSKWSRHIGEGIDGVPGDNKLRPFGDDSGMQIRISSGEAMVRGHYYLSTAQETLLIDSPTDSQTRIDAVVLELDPTANRIILKIVEGPEVPSSPIPPTLTQTDAGIYQMLLGYVTIPAGTTSITSEMVSDFRSYMNSGVGLWRTATRPTNPVASKTIGFNVDLSLHEYWNGSTWLPMAPEAPSQFLLMGA